MSICTKLASVDYIQFMIDLIKAATLINDKDVQKNAETSILKFRMEQPQEFLLENVQIFQSTDIATNIRQASGTLLTGSVKLTMNDLFLWDSLSAPNKSSFKDMVLGAMIDKQRAIRRAAASIVAAICCIQIPRNQWDGIVEKISSNMKHNDEVVREVSILTIGFICQQLREFNFNFGEQMQQTMLTGILLGVQQKNQNISETAFKALRDGIPAVSFIMKNNQYRDFLIQQIADAINKKNHTELAIQSLIEIAKCYYEYMSPAYIQCFAVILDPIIKNSQEDNLCILAMEFWATVAKEQSNIESNVNRNKLIHGPLASSLAEALLQNLCVIEEENGQANGVSQSAASCLEAFFENDATPYEEKVLTFTANTIRHENWKYRQASIRAFATLLMGLSATRAQELVNLSLIQLVKLLNDLHPAVQLSAIRSLNLISQQTGQVILQHKEFVGILDVIVNKLNLGQSFLRNGCRIIDNLCNTCTEMKFDNFNPIADHLIKLLLEYSLDTTRTIAAISSCMTSILNIIKIANNPAVSNSYIDWVLAHITKIGDLQKERRELYYSSFFTMLQVCLISLRHNPNGVPLDKLSLIYNLVISHYTRIKDVDSDGFYVISALAYFYKDRRLVDDFWKYIEHGLTKTNEAEIFKAAISCICDFASIYRDQIQDRMSNILGELIKIFENNTITRELKLDLLMCFGQLFLQCRGGCINHLQRVIELLLISCECVVRINDINYAEVLQQTIIETFMCLFHGLNDKTPNLLLGKYIQHVYEFVKMTTDKSRRPKLEYVKSCLFLIADIAGFYPNEFEPYKKMPFIGEIIKILQKYNKAGELTQVLNYARSYF